MEHPKTLEDAMKYRYNRWAGNPKGNEYQPDRCAYEVHERGRGILFYQCARRNGYGPAGLYCKQHAKIVDK